MLGTLMVHTLYFDLCLSLCHDSSVCRLFYITIANIRCGIPNYDSYYSRV